jgi:hypothetical protein
MDLTIGLRTNICISYINYTGNARWDYVLKVSGVLDNYCVNQWASGPHLGGPTRIRVIARARNTLFFWSIATKKLYCRHTEGMQHAVRHETKCNEARVFNTDAYRAFPWPPLVNRSRSRDRQRWRLSSRWLDRVIDFVWNFTLEESKPPGVQRFVEVTD